MKRTDKGDLIYSPSDLIRYLGSPFASWMDRYHAESPGVLTPDEDSEEEKLIARTGDEHELDVLKDFWASCPQMVTIDKLNSAEVKDQTIAAFKEKAPLVYQAALEYGPFAGFADFIELGADGNYQVWDTKLARSPKPYYAIQLCCYAEMLAGTLGTPLPEKFGVILGDKERVEFRVEDFIHYYYRIKSSFLALQGDFDGDFSRRPEPLPRADHGRWTSHAQQFFTDSDHLVQVAGISIGQIKKLKKDGIATLAGLATASGRAIPKLAKDSLEKLASQARLQQATTTLRKTNPACPPQYEVLPLQGSNGEAVGLGALPHEHPADVFFDMEGFPLVDGGLEYLFGVCTRDKVNVNGKECLEFRDWWAHDREQEKLALEGFVDWVFERWTANHGMHIYHYAPYEVSAVRRLSTRHDTRQEEVDTLLRNEVFVDLYKLVQRGLRVGEGSYSIKSIERLYRPKRSTEVSSAVGSIVHYSLWRKGNEGRDWKTSPILKGIRDYNEDDCVSTAELDGWLRAERNRLGVPFANVGKPIVERKPQSAAETAERDEVAAKLRESGDPTSIVLADLLDYHRREAKPMWWRRFDRADSEPEVLRDDADCIEGVETVGVPTVIRRSLGQAYRFDPTQECKLEIRDESRMMFTHLLDTGLSLEALDADKGTLLLSISKDGLARKLGGNFPQQGSLIPDEFVRTTEIQASISEAATSHLNGQLHATAAAVLNRVAPTATLREVNESTLEAAIRVTASISGDCLIIQGPPGTGKTYTAARVIMSLLATGKRIGITSNGRKVIINLLEACGKAAREAGTELMGILVGADENAPVFSENPKLLHVEKNGGGFAAYKGGVAGGTAWMFSLPDWNGVLDFLFIDEAGQVPLANAVAMSRCAKNIVLLGDQMQLEQPLQGSHPGDSGMSVLQYMLKDPVLSKEDAPIYHPVVPPDFGLFLGESRRMHPDVCDFISESIYEGRLGAHLDCARQTISVDTCRHVSKGTGIMFSPVEHDGNVQCSEEEMERVVEIFQDLIGRPYTAKDGSTRPLELQDFLFISPYNAQVRLLKASLPANARVGSVDKFQGQEAPVCILSLCSSYGEYASRGLGFILNRSRLNVAISRAQCLAVVVADPRIAESPVNSIESMKVVNLFCKVAGYGIASG